MLEPLDQHTLRTRLGLVADKDGAPAIAPVAKAVRTCVGNWRSPARQRVSAYLHRQLVGLDYDEQQARERVRDVIDALIDIGDLTTVRLDGTPSLVLSRASTVRISDSDFIALGTFSPASLTDQNPWRYARAVSRSIETISTVSFDDWLGPADYRAHLARRGGSSGGSTISEYWATLVSALRHEGNPLDRAQLRAVVGQPSADKSYFGRHQLPDGRWSTNVPVGIWCAVRPGRNPNEWHPVLVEVTEQEVRAIDLFDWDEWNWALLARAITAGNPERSAWQEDVLAFEHPIPRQFVRGLRLLGGPGDRAWTWRLNDAGFYCFENWRRSEL